MLLSPYVPLKIWLKFHLWYGSVGEGEKEAWLLSGPVLKSPHLPITQASSSCASCCPRSPDSEGNRDRHTFILVVDPALGHAVGRALTLQLALGFGGQVLSVGFPCLYSCWPVFNFPEAVPMVGRHFWLKGVIIICIILPVSLFLQTRRGNGKTWLPQPLSRSQTHTQKSSKCSNSMCATCRVL